MNVSSGISFVDVMLEGGYDNDVITTIYGPPGSGKTNFCLMAMTAVLDKKILYIDTEGSFSIARFKQVCPHYDQVLERTIFLTPTTYEEQREAFDFMRKVVDDKFGLIIIDSIASLYRLELAANSDVQNVNRMLGLHMAMLTEVARKNKIPVIMTNQVYADFEDRERTRTIGGDIMKYWSRAMLEIHRLKGDIRKLTVVKHRSIPEGKFSNFRIVRDGLEEVNG